MDGVLVLVSWNGVFDGWWFQLVGVFDFDSLVSWISLKFGVVSCIVYFKK